MSIVRVVLGSLILGVALGGGAAAAPLISPATLERLALATERYKAIVAAGGWHEVPEGPALRSGATGRRVALLRARLSRTGDLGPGSRAAAAFDDALAAAVKRFQRRHGLIETGVVYQSTRDALNLPAAARLARLNENLARLRDLGAGEGAGRYVAVNIPDYSLEAVAGGRVELRSRVIVGRTETPTPAMRKDITSLTFLPDWRVPNGVVSRVVLPLMRADRETLARLGIRVFTVADGRRRETDPATVNWFMPASAKLVFRQDPGPLNALGLVRINMPNDRVILLHDTPYKDAFERAFRTFSAGCVRVERIFELSAWLLRGRAGWDRERIDRTVAAGHKTTVILPRPVPVRLVYLTAWVDGAGVTQFRPDIYRLDTPYTEMPKQAAAGPDPGRGRM